MRDRYRLKRIVKWAGLWVCISIVMAGWWTSREGRVSLVRIEPAYTVSIFESRISIWIYPRHRNLNRWANYSVPPNIRRSGLERGWHYDSNFGHRNILSRYGLDLPHVAHQPSPPLCVVGSSWLAAMGWWTWYIRIPFWLPFILVGLPTAFLWWRDRPFPKGCCQSCGYNLTGNASGICPECGTRIVNNTGPESTRSHSRSESSEPSHSIPG